MSQDTFKYLNQEKQGSGAAQDFLNEKLSKNKYMSVNNPDNPYSMGAGTTPGGEAYEMDREVITPAKTTFEGGLDMKRTETGHANDGKYSAEELRQKFGLSYDADREAKGFKTGSEGENTNNDNEVWYETSSGEKKLLGYKEGGLESLLDNKELQSVRSADTERFDPDNGFNSASDVAGTLKYLTEVGEEKTTEAVVDESPLKPIEHSAEINQAKERVQQYEQDVMSGKTSNEIYGKGEAMAEDKYVFDATQGSAGIGSSPVSASDQASTDATASFLNKKVSDTKDKYQFTPAS